MTEDKTDLRYIAIEGPVGVGKTSLANRLAKDYQARLILEQVDDNPFLERFYSGDKSIALPTQLYFLLTRVRQLKELNQEDIFSSLSISDFILDKDRLFASLTLEQLHFNLYERIYDSVTGDYAPPDLVVYLQAPVEVLIQRILKRGRRFERDIEEKYLQNISLMYSDFFYHYDKGPVLTINTGSVDFVENEHEYQNLKEVIFSVGPGKNYYNPLASNAFE